MYLLFPFARQFWLHSIRFSLRTFTFSVARRRLKTLTTTVQTLDPVPGTSQFPLLTTHCTSSTVRNQIHISSAMPSQKLDSVPDVDIDSDGRFKYILIKLVDNSSGTKESKFIVRGYSRAGYHADIYDEVEPSVRSLGLESDCVGGGRILHEKDKKTLKVFGYSTGFGKADHSISTEILKKKYPDYTITWSDEGY